jgi:Spy/CpxP family protein refolding chaperone
MLKTNLRILSGTVLILFALFISSAAYAQDGSMKSQDPSFAKNAETWTAQLNKKVNLTPDQQTKIQAMLVDYQKANTDNSKASDLMSSYSSKIESLLNDNQKKLYKGFQADWWKTINGTSSSSSDKSGY